MSQNNRKEIMLNLLGLPIDSDSRNQRQGYFKDTSFGIWHCHDPPLKEFHNQTDTKHHTNLPPPYWAGQQREEPKKFAFDCCQVALGYS